MRIQDLDSLLENAKNQAIAATGVERSTAEDIAYAPPPEPDMGDRGFPCFALAPELRKGPPIIAKEVADALRDQLSEYPIIAEVSTAGPYVNLRFDRGRVAELVIRQALTQGPAFGADTTPEPGQWMIEFSAPNTNKPQHLGHVRNNLIGDALSRIIDFAGHDITRVNLINDRGIHICKSMLAYQLFGDGETPATTGEKGDHFVGRYYVLFNQKFQAEYEAFQKSDKAQQCFDSWLDSSDSKSARKQYEDDVESLRSAFFDAFSDTYFNDHSDLGAQARALLRQWEAGDEDTVALWKQMNQWVIDGFDETYDRFGIEFDRVYRESKTYTQGKAIVDEGLDSGLFHEAYDGAVVCDLAKVGLEGEKVLLRSDGTSVYMTQDLGTAVARFDEFNPDHLVYVVADEQQYHFEVLFRILTELRPEFSGRLHHLSYGLVELPEGKMKSREGKVVDADDLLDEMVELATEAVNDRYDNLDDDQISERAGAIGLAALKFYILDFAPRTTVQFDPQRSIDFQGRTGPYCLYGYARIASIGRRFQGWPELDDQQSQTALRALGTERELAVIRVLLRWPDRLSAAVNQQNPGRITEHLFELCSAFSSLYNDPDHRIVELDGPRQQGLLLLAQATQHAIAAGLKLLGIPTLEEM